jgi:tetratricopeptide (TPR) repeat protein
MGFSLLESSSGERSGEAATARAQVVKPSRRWLRVFVTAVSLAVIGGVGTFVIYPQCRAQWDWHKARQAFQDGELPQAQALLEQCLRTWPGSGEAHFLLARTMRRQGDFTGARRHLQAARRNDWAISALDLEYKLIQAQSGGVRAAEAALLEYVEADHPESPLILEALIQGYLQNNLLSDAYRWCTAWMTGHAGQWQPHYWRGLVLERGLKLALAADDYQAALALRPGHRETRHRLAQILLRIGKFEEALPHFEAYLRDQPDDPVAVVGCARCLRALARGDEARELAERWLERSEGSAPLLVLLGQLESDRDRPAEALAWLRRAEALTPADRELLQTLAASPSG